MNLGASKKLTDLRPRMKDMGLNISGWCRRDGYNRRTAELSLKGERNGKVASEIRRKAAALNFNNSIKNMKETQTTVSRHWV